MEFLKQVDEYIAKKPQWSAHLNFLRSIVSGTQLQETLKWGAPVYALDGKNVVSFGGFKSHACMWFFQGSSMKDPLGVLVNAQPGKTKAMRQWRFQSMQDIPRDQVKSYIEEAIKNQRAGKRILASVPGKKPLVIPPEMQTHFDKHPQTEAIFASLSLSKRREFSEYIIEAKRAETKLKRLDKVEILIKEGKGLYEKYK